MEISTAKTPLSEQISGLHISTDKFKTARISLSFILPLDQKTAAYSALLAKILCRSTQKYPTPSLLKSRLNYLYGAALHSLTMRLGDNQLLSFSITSLCNRYALSGEKISRMSSDLLREVVFEPNLDGTAFKAEDFEVEKRLVIEEIESLINDKRRYAVTKMLEAMCENEPFGTVNDIETVNAITREELFAFWQNMLKTAPVVVIVTGQEDPQPVYEVFKSSLQTIGRHPRSIAPEFKRVAPQKVKDISEEMAITQGKLVMGFRCGASSLNENIAPVKVMTDIFGGAPYSKLFTVVREKMSLCYYCAARLYSVKGIVCVDSGIEMENFERARDGILKQLELMKSGDFTDDVITASKIGLSDSIRSVGDSLTAIENWYLSHIFDAKPASPEQFIESIHAVTREDIVKAAGQLQLDTIYLLKGNGGDANE